MPPGVSGPPILATSHLWLSDAKTALLSPVLLELQLLTTSWAFLETEVPQALSPWPSIPSFPLCIGSWEQHQQDFQGHQGLLCCRTEPDWGPLPYLICRRTGCPVLISLPDVMALEEATPLLDPLATWGAPGINWVNSSGSLYTFHMLLPPPHVTEVHWRATAFYPLTRTPLIKDKTQGSTQLAKLQACI